LGFAHRRQLARTLTAECPVLGNRMIFWHVLEAVSGGVLATHHVQFTGWLASLFMRTVGADVRKGLPLTMTRLKHLCRRTGTPPALNGRYALALNLKGDLLE
jgi:hypothetical protein